MSIRRNYRKLAWNAALRGIGLLLLAGAAGSRAHAAPGDTLFEDDFNGNLNDWTVDAPDGEAEITNDTAQQGGSLRLGNGEVTVTSDPIGAAVPAARLDIWVRRGHDSFSEDPDVGEDLVVEYRAEGGDWIEFLRLPGDGMPGEIFELSLSLPVDALHPNLGIRFSVTDGSLFESPPPPTFDNDFWHVDNPAVVETAPPGEPISYRFEEDEWTGAGGEVEETSGSGLNGTAAGGATTADATPAIAGDPGTCRYGELDGNDDYVEIPDDPALDLANEFTVAAWINMRSYPSGLHTIVSKDTNYEFHIDDAGRVYWWWEDDNFRTNGYSISLNQWHHVAITFRPGSQTIYVDGVPRATNGYTGTLPQNDLPLHIGTDWNFISRAFDGFIDEVTIIPRALSESEVNTLMNETHDCPTAAAQFSINHDGYGIHCVAESITVDVVDPSSGTPRTDYDATVELDTQSGSGNWQLLSGGGSLSDATADDGIATYDWPLNESQAVFGLYYPEGPPQIDVDVYQASDPGIRDTDAEGLLEFSPNGFTLTAAPLSNPPGAVVDFAAAQTAAVDFPVYLAAYGQTPGDPECGIIESYTGAKDLEFWFDYEDPGSGTRAPTVDGAAAAAGEGGTSAQPVSFTDGQAAVNVSYKDVGQLQLHVKDETTGNADLPDGIRGATAGFVVRPADFELSGIVSASGTANDPSVDGPEDAVFARAGEQFSATVTALDADGDPTPNYGRESTPESVALDASLFRPAGGADPPVSAGTGFGAFSDGSATGSDFVWNEVGIVELVPRVEDGDYLGAGDVVGSSPVRVGRFIPDHFGVSLNTPLLAATCTAGGFSYEGEPFGFTPGGEPVITVEARSVSGGATLNYTSDFFMLDEGTSQNRVYSSANGTLDTSALPPESADPAVAEIDPGRGTLTFSTGPDGLAFARGSPVAPYAADITLSIDVRDADGVVAVGAGPLGNPVTFGTSGGIAFDGGDEIRYGRVRLSNAVGSERVRLPVPAVVEHFAGAGTGFVTNTDDACTTDVGISLGGFTEDLDPGETCVLDSGSPGASGAGCVSPAPADERFQDPADAGNLNLRLEAPGAGNSGSVTVTASVPAWLTFDWDAGAAGEEDPSATAAFGLYQGVSQQIYLRELY